MTRLPSKVAPATTRTTTSRLKGKSDRAEPKSEGDAAIQSADSDTSVNPRVGRHPLATRCGSCTATSASCSWRRSPLKYLKYRRCAQIPSAMAYNRAFMAMNVGGNAIAHVRKDGQNPAEAEKYPFGSIFWHNSARCTGS